MQILIVSATYLEISPLLEKIFPDFDSNKIFSQSEWKGINISILVTGVGSASTSFQLTKLLSGNFIPDLTIFSGIGGEISREFELGHTYLVVKENFSDLGAFDENGQFQDLWDLKLMEENAKPFTNRSIVNPIGDEFKFLPQVEGITSNCVSSSNETLNKISIKFPDARIESMEGAYQFYVASQFNLKFLSLRSTSNYVGERDKSLWQIPLAIENLNRTIGEILELLADLVNSKE